jgi:CRP/FNR family transcriptional regulator, nitrogen fixation regulation protein
VGQEVVGEGDPTENFFLVVRGLFRAVKFTRDGRRQVFAFYMRGDMCGLEPDATHKLTVEAINKSAMYIWRKRLGALGSQEARQLCELETENARLKKLAAEHHPEIEVMTAA